MKFPWTYAPHGVKRDKSSQVIIVQDNYFIRNRAVEWICYGAIVSLCFLLFLSFNRRRNPDCPCDREKLDKEKVLMSTYSFTLCAITLIQFAHHTMSCNVFKIAGMSLGAS